jgi:hypothetical protein
VPAVSDPGTLASQEPASIHLSIKKFKTALALQSGASASKLHQEVQEFKTALALQSGASASKTRR